MMLPGAVWNSVCNAIFTHYTFQHYAALLYGFDMLFLDTSFLQWKHIHSAGGRWSKAETSELIPYKACPHTLVIYVDVFLRDIYLGVRISRGQLISLHYRLLNYIVSNNTLMVAFIKVLLTYNQTTNWYSCPQLRSAFSMIHTWCHEPGQKNFSTVPVWSESKCSWKLSVWAHLS